MRQRIASFRSRRISIGGEVFLNATVRAIPSRIDPKEIVQPSTDIWAESEGQYEQDQEEQRQRERDREA